MFPLRSPNQEAGVMHQLPTSRSANRRAKTQRFVAGVHGEPGVSAASTPVPTSRTGLRGLKAAGRLRTRRNRTIRRDCARDLQLILDEVVSEDEMLLTRRKRRKVEVEGMSQDALLVNQLEDEEVFEELADLFEEPVLFPLSPLSQPGTHEDEMYSHEFVSTLIDFAVDDFTDDSRHEIISVNNDDSDDAGADVHFLDATVSEFAQKSLEAALIVDIEDSKVNSDEDDWCEHDSVSVKSFCDSEAQDVTTIKPWDISVSTQYVDEDDEEEVWDDEDSSSSVVMFRNEYDFFRNDCDFESENNVAELMACDLLKGPAALPEVSVNNVAELIAGDLLKGPSALPEMSVNMVEFLEIVSALPVASTLGPCIRRRFPRRLRPSEMGPIALQEVLPIECLPVSQPIVMSRPPCKEIQSFRCSLKTREPHFALSVDPAEILFELAKRSYASLLQVATTEACHEIQKHWRHHQQQKVVKDPKDGCSTKSTPTHTVFLALEDDERPSYDEPAADGSAPCPFPPAVESLPPVELECEERSVRATVNNYRKHICKSVTDTVQKVSVAVAKKSSQFDVKNGPSCKFGDKRGESNFGVVFKKARSKVAGSKVILSINALLKQI